MAGRPWFAANEVLAFLLELTALAALGWWGFSAGSGAVFPWLLGLGTPLAAMLAWGAFAAPRARVRLPLAGVLCVKAVVLGGGALAVYGVGHPVAAAVLGLVTLVNAALSEAYRRRMQLRP
ncbi:YrdB family protein [Streptomyces sp. N2-109]|uniref:YrdB family protein n=1 Tax=Streptomyces gossypii TaxID=2883101 RepID=A0ABT2JU65_9ACTN|nr:YrdB family protein [Streptomyces gossypii]MCT2590829.1 YrdB family protein [Streptomyces gossypii]